MNSSTFRDRKDAGQLLAGRLATKRYAQPVVVALSRGGVPVAFEVAKLLEAPLDIVLFGSLTNGSDGARTSGAQSSRNVELDHGEIARRESTYRGGRPPADVAARTVILVDECMSGSASVKAALQRIRSASPKRIVVGVPVAPRDVIEEIDLHADDMTCLFVAAPARALAEFYADFSTVSDAEAIALMERAAELRRVS